MIWICSSLYRCCSPRTPPKCPSSPPFQIRTKRRTRRGKPGALVRPSKRHEHANRVHAQWHVIEIELGPLVKGGRMTAAIDLHRERMPVRCDRLEVATKSRLQALWKRIKRQYNTAIPSGSECDCSTVAANDEKQFQCYLPAFFYSHSRRICRHGRIQGLYRQIQGTSTPNMRHCTPVRPEVCIHVVTRRPRIVDICPLRLLLAPCEETNAANT